MSNSDEKSTSDIADLNLAAMNAFVKLVEEDTVLDTLWKETMLQLASSGIPADLQGLRRIWHDDNGTSSESSES